MTMATQMKHAANLGDAAAIPKNIDTERDQNGSLVQVSKSLGSLGINTSAIGIKEPIANGSIATDKYTSHGSLGPLGEDVTTKQGGII
jgi:hypothetical protein